MLIPGIGEFSQLTKSPRRQARQWPQWPPYHPTPTRWPFTQPITPAPTSSTIPAISWPGTRGYWMPGQWPSFVNISLWQMPHACTRTRTSPGPGCGTSRSTNSIGPPGRVTCATFILAMRILLPRNLSERLPVALKELRCRMMKKVVAAGLPRHRALKSTEIWRGKPAATTRRTAFSSSC